MSAHLQRGRQIAVLMAKWAHLKKKKCSSQELACERQEKGRLLKAQQDKDDLIDKLKEEMDLLYRVSVASGLPPERAAG